MGLFKDLERFEFLSVNLVDLGEEEKKFVEALRLITDGETVESEVLLLDLYFGAEQPFIQNTSAQLLFDIYFELANWDQIQSLGLLNYERIDETNRLIARICAQSKRTTLSFAKEEIILPLNRSVSGSPMIEVNINGKVRNFWLDTGAGMTVVSTSVANECAISLIKNMNLDVGNSTNGQVASQFAFIDGITIQDLTIKHLPALVIPDNQMIIQNPNTKEEMIIDGILGWDVIKRLSLTINEQESRVVINKPIMKLDRERNLFHCGYPIVKVKGENQVPLYFGLDTGASKSHFGVSLLSKMNQLETFKKTMHVGGIGGVKEVEIDLLKQVTVFLKDRPVQLENIRQSLIEYAIFFKLDGVFGTDLFKNKNLLIDFPNRTIMLKE